MSKFRKKPAEIEAFRWTYDPEPEWWKDLKGVTVEVNTGAVFIPTLEGTMKAQGGDYIIKDATGQISTCKPDVFEATYELV